MTDKCSRCGEYLWSWRQKPCKCQPFEIEHEGEKETIWALYAHSAAEKWAIDYNEGGDYSLIDDSTVISINGERYRVSAEPSIHYSIDTEDSE